MNQIALPAMAKQSAKAEAQEVGYSPLRSVWQGSKRSVLGLDIEILHHPDVVADNTGMPFRNEALDVVVYDPPHIPNQGKITRRISMCGSDSCCAHRKRTSTLSRTRTHRSSVTRTAT
jgi:hypothetical protein